MWTRHGASRRGAALRSSARYAAVEFCGVPAEVGACITTQRSLCFAFFFSLSGGERLYGPAARLPSPLPHPAYLYFSACGIRICGFRFGIKN